MSSFGDLNRVNTNIQSLNAQLSLNRVNRDLGQSQLRLSTGLRINRAEDDTAGFSMATKLKSRVTGLNEAIGNVGDAKAMLDIAESSFDAIFDNLLEMKALATRAGTDSMGDSERLIIGQQIAALGNVINDTAAQTIYQDKKLLGGDPVDPSNPLVFNFLIGERGQDIISVDLDRVDVDMLFRGSSALQNVSSTTVDDFDIAGATDATHIAIKVGSTMSSEKHIIKLVDDVSDGGWTGEQITGNKGSGIRGGYGEEFIDRLIDQLEAKNIDGVWGEKVEDVAEVRGEWTFTITEAFSSASSTFTIGGVDIGVTSGAAAGAEISSGSSATEQAGQIVAILNADNDFFAQYTAVDNEDGTFTITENEGMAGWETFVFERDGIDGGDGFVGDVTTDTASRQSEWSFVLHNTNTEEVSFSLLHTSDSSATASYNQVGATNLSVDAAEDPNNRLEFDRRGSNLDGSWNAADFRTFLADVDKAIGSMMSLVNTVGIAQSTLTISEETLSRTVSSNQSAVSRIMDTDFAKEQSNSIRLQILQQTATSALAQANFGPQAVLGFLG